ncbi:MAG: hypoxanthine phosphoribosyltransferase [Desulfuromonadales bacterium]|nr:hypoxanthine phosphoribosyltransferase [Desulfuromonadales bacterium]
MHNANLALLYSQERIAAEVSRLAEEINRDYAGRELLVVGILKGSFLFIADLVRQLTVPVTIDFMRLASYGTETQSSGIVELRKDIELPVQGKDLLIVEDIVDSGLTLDTLHSKLMQKKPGSLKICTLIEKTGQREGSIKPDYVGLSMESGFIVGYGLDFNEQYRQLPDIHLLG